MLPIPSFILEKVLYPIWYENRNITNFEMQELKACLSPELLESILKIQNDVVIERSPDIITDQNNYVCWEILQIEKKYNLKPLTFGSAAQIENGEDCRARTLRLEPALQNVLVGAEIYKFSLFEEARNNNDARFWMDNWGECTRRFRYILEKLRKSDSKDFKYICKVPKTYNYLKKGEHPIWEANCLSSGSINSQPTAIF
jgi:hypothetical protein